MTIRAAMFQLHIDTENPAFGSSSYQKRYELHRLLRVVSVRVLRGEKGGTIRDTKGNSVGSFEEVS